MRDKVFEFESKFGMILAFGCIDGTHIPICRPMINSQDFFCYKQYFSLSVQAICNYKGYFMDLECMWPGCVHDAKVFANSIINTKLRNAIFYKHLKSQHKKQRRYLIILLVIQPIH